MSLVSVSRNASAPRDERARTGAPFCGRKCAGGARSRLRSGERAQANAARAIAGSNQEGGDEEMQADISVAADRTQRNEAAVHRRVGCDDALSGARGGDELKGARHF